MNIAKKKTSANAASKLGKELSHIQHDGEELVDLHDARETINNTQHKEGSCEQLKVKSTLKRRSSSSFISVVSTLTFH